jgi:hypothetical protein
MAPQFADRAEQADVFVGMMVGLERTSSRSCGREFGLVSKTGIVSVIVKAFADQPSRRKSGGAGRNRTDA